MKEIEEDFPFYKKKEKGENSIQFNESGATNLLPWELHSAWSPQSFELFVSIGALCLFILCIH